MVAKSQNGLSHGEHNEAMLRSGHASIVPLGKINPSWININVFLSINRRRKPRDYLD